MLLRADNHKREYERDSSRWCALLRSRESRIYPSRNVPDFWPRLNPAGPHLSTCSLQDAGQGRYRASIRRAAPAVVCSARHWASP